MKKRYLPFKTNLESEYPELHLLFFVEGGAYYFSEKHDKLYVLSDFGTLSDFLEQDELDELKIEYEFSNKKECRYFINNLGKDIKNAQKNIRFPKRLLQ